jgi:hypothetical protein
MSESGPERLQDQRTELATYFQREVGVVRNVGNSMNIADLAEEHLSHEEMFRKSMPSVLGKAGNVRNAFHLPSLATIRYPIARSGF